MGHFWRRSAVSGSSRGSRAKRKRFRRQTFTTCTSIRRTLTRPSTSIPERLPARRKRCGAGSRRSSCSLTCCSCSRGSTDRAIHTAADGCLALRWHVTNTRQAFAAHQVWSRPRDHAVDVVLPRTLRGSVGRAERSNRATWRCTRAPLHYRETAVAHQPEEPCANRKTSPHPVAAVGVLGHDRPVM